MGKRKQLTALIVAVCVAFAMCCFSACSEKDDQKKDSGAQKKTEQQGKQKSKKSGSSSDKKASAEKEQKKAEVRKAAGKKAAENAKIKEQQSKKPVKKSNVSKKGNTKTRASKKAKKRSDKTHKTQKKRTENKPSKEPATCMLTIECTKIVGKKDLDPGTRSLVPSDGYILKNAEIEVEKADTVYDVLVKGRDKYGFVLNVENTQFGKYIAGIGGIEEKACGDESGWKYKINGNYPGKSCQKIKVSSGDRIVWLYVLKA